MRERILFTVIVFALTITLLPPPQYYHHEQKRQRQRQMQKAQCIIDGNRISFSLLNVFTGCSMLSNFRRFFLLIT